MLLKVFYQVFHLPLTLLSVILTGISSISWLRTVFLMPTKILPSQEYRTCLQNTLEKQFQYMSFKSFVPSIIRTKSTAQRF